MTHLAFTVALDPGVRVAGVALGLGAELRAAHRVEVPAEEVGGDGRALACAVMAERAAAWVVSYWREAPRAPDATFEVAVVGEWPRVLNRAHQRSAKVGADANDLLPLAGVDVALLALLRREFRAPPCVRVASASPNPDEWKGQAPKPETARRVLARLSEAERAVLPTLPRGGYDHNVLDAVGIFLKHVGRFEPVRDYG